MNHQPTLRSPIVLSGFAGFVLVGCATALGSDPTAREEDELTTTYGELFTTLAPADLDRWMALRSTLVRGFDRICGDTICSGDYSNLATVSLTCSSTAKMRKMKDCSWVLGGSIDSVEATTGAIATDARTFACKIPVGGNAKSLLTALEAAGDDALHATLPGTSGSFYDGLVACFAGVTGGPPHAGVSSAAFVELGDWSWEHGDGAAWSETRRRLNSGFDEVCGDTFCEGDYADIRGLRFVCAVSASALHVTSCSWSFAATNASVDRRGTIVSDSTVYTCPIAIDADASELARALAGPDPLNAPLPHRTTSIYDALVECL